MTITIQAATWDTIAAGVGSSVALAIDKVVFDTPNFPPGCHTYVVGNGDGGAGSLSLTESGYTLLSNQNQNPNLCSLWVSTQVRQWDDTPDIVTVNGNSNKALSAGAFSVLGAANAREWFVTTDDPGNTVISTPETRSKSPNAVHVVICLNENSATFTDDSVGYSAIIDQGDMNMRVITKTIATPGVIPTITFTTTLPNKRLKLLSFVLGPQCRLGWNVA